MRITNLTNSPYDLRAADGSVVRLPARGEVDIDPHPMHIGTYRTLGYFRIEVGLASTQDPAADEPDLDDLRAQYEDLFGHAPDGRWRAPRIQAAIAAKLSE